MTATEAQPGWALVNGELSQSIGVHNRGLAFGDGLFETMRVVQGAIPLVNYHLARLTLGLQRLGIPLDQQQLTGELRDFLVRIGAGEQSSGRAKLMVTRADGGRGVYPSDKSHNLRVMLFQPGAPQGWLQPPMNLRSCDIRLAHQPALAGMKHLSRLEYVVAAQQPGLQSGEEWLLLDQDDRVVETVHHNIFALAGNTVYTPNLDSCGVKGVSRQYLLEVVLPALGFQVETGDYSVNDFRGAEAVWINNAFAGITPITAIDGLALTGSVAAAETVAAKLTEAVASE